MIISIKAEADDDDNAEMIFDNEFLDNENYVNVRIKKKDETIEEYTVSVEDIYHVAGLFNNIRMEHKTER